MASFKKVAVIGAGVMGSGIAAHLANAGADVVLLDLDVKFAREGIAKQLKAGGFMRADFAGRVTAGATSDLSLLADADWIIEAVAEKPEIKRDLFQKLESVRKDGSIISSNTSTIPLDVLTEGLGARFAGDFLITHFFNPPRYMRLLEIVSSPQTRPEALEAVRAFSDVHLGKGLVTCKDTPGFIANRIGCMWLAAGLVEALKLGVSVEEADADHRQAVRHSRHRRLRPARSGRRRSDAAYPGQPAQDFAAGRPGAELFLRHPAGQDHGRGRPHRP